MNAEPVGRGLQVIGAGFGRSGTTSLRKALHILGYAPCYHMQTTLTHYLHMRFWVRAKAGEPVDFRRFFRRYRATVDWPACEFYRELLAAYPQAKVVLTLRDADEWYDSVSGTLWQIRSVLPAWFPRSVWQMQEDVIWQGRFRGAFADREQALATYRAHLDEVRRTVPAAQLLEYRVADGWGPLCAFLERPVPQGVPFPRLNDRTFFGRLLGALRLARWLGPAALLAAILAIAHALLR